MADKFPVNVAFSYNGTDVVYDDNRLISLTAMWKAAGSPNKQDPRQWRRKEGAGFINDLARSLNVPVGRITKSGRGKGVSAGTWGHWQTALAYAKYLSHDFHRFVNDAFREWAEEKANPDLKAERAIDGYRERGKDDRWILARLEGGVARRRFTDTLQEHGVKGSGYALCTDAITKEVIGSSTRELRLARALPASAKTRDNMDAVELAAIRFAEAMAAQKVSDRHACGNNQCCTVCHEAGVATRKAMDLMEFTRKRA